MDRWLEVPRNFDKWCGLSGEKFSQSDVRILTVWAVAESAQLYKEKYAASHASIALRSGLSLRVHCGVDSQVTLQDNAGWPYQRESSWETWAGEDRQTRVYQSYVLDEPPEEELLEEDITPIPMPQHYLYYTVQL